MEQLFHKGQNVVFVRVPPGMLILEGTPKEGVVYTVKDPCSDRTFECVWITLNEIEGVQFEQRGFATASDIDAIESEITEALKGTPETL